MGEVRRIDVDGGQLEVEIDGDGPAVVLMHGGLLDRRMWAPQVPALSVGHMLIRHDLRGYGRSSVPTGPYRHCDDVAAVLDALGVDRAVVGGESFGGAVAVDTAFAHPDRVAGLVLEAAGPITGWQWVDGFPAAPALRLARTEGVDAAKAAFAELPMFDVARGVPDAASLLHRMLEDYSGWHLEHRDPATFAVVDAVDRLDEITAPALVIIGGRDVLDLRLTGERLAEGLTGARRAYLDELGHAPNMEDPAVVDRLVLQFLAEIGW